MIHIISTLITTVMQATTQLRVIIRCMACQSTIATVSARLSTTPTSMNSSTARTTSSRCSEQPQLSSTTRTPSQPKPLRRLTKEISESHPPRRKSSPSNRNLQPLSRRKRMILLLKRLNRTTKLQHRPRSNYHQWLCTRMPYSEHRRLMLTNCCDDCCDICLELNKLQMDCCPL